MRLAILFDLDRGGRAADVAAAAAVAAAAYVAAAARVATAAAADRRSGGREIAAAAPAADRVVRGTAAPVVAHRRVRAERDGAAAVALARAPVRVVRGEYAAERVAELGVEYRVDDRVERRVGVAEPREHLERGHGYARLAERRDDVGAEERHPAQQERAHDHAHRDGRLVVAHVVRRRVVVVVHGRQRGRGRRVGAGRHRRRRGRRRRRASRQRPRHRAYALHVLLRVPVQPAVDADHHHARYVEADARRDDRVLGRQVQRARHVLRGHVALRAVLPRRLVDAQYADGHHGHERGQRPDDGYAEQRVPPVQIRRVPTHGAGEKKKQTL